MNVNERFLIEVQWCLELLHGIATLSALGMGDFSMRETFLMIALSAGLVMGWLPVDIASLNSSLTGQGFPELKDNVVLHGVNGMVQLSEKVDIGGIALGNATTSIDGDRISKYSFSYGGGVLNYSVQQDSFYDIRIGAMLGGGRATLFLRENANLDFDDAIVNFQQTVMRRSFISIQPQVELVLTPTKWLKLRGTAGYLLTLDGGWEQHGVSLSGPPDSLSNVIASFGVEFAFRVE